MEEPTGQLELYRRSIGRFPLLDRDEERRLAERYRESDDLDAARRLIIGNLRLVVKIAYAYRRSYPNVLDLIQEGNVGLVQAVRRYDPGRGVKLSTYAAWWIRAYILRFILDNWRMVRIGTTRAERRLFYNLRREQERLERLGFEPDHRLLAERLDVEERDVDEMAQRLGSPDVSLDRPLEREDEEGPPRVDLIAGEPALRPDVAAEATEFLRLLRGELDDFGAGLRGRERVLFEERLLGEPPATLQKLGDRFGVSRERVRQIERRLLGRLRDHLERALGGEVEIGARE